MDGDAGVAAKLATAFAADAVRLGPDRWPDCELRTNNVVQEFEITEADIEGRRRGDEYKEAAANPQKWRFDPGEDWIARDEQAPKALRRAAEAKAKGLSKIRWPRDLP